LCVDCSPRRANNRHTTSWISRVSESPSLVESAILPTAAVDKKLIGHYQAGDISAALLLLNATVRHGRLFHAGKMVAFASPVIVWHTPLHDLGYPIDRPRFYWYDKRVHFHSQEHCKCQPVAQNSVCISITISNARAFAMLLHRMILHHKISKIKDSADDGDRRVRYTDIRDSYWFQQIRNPDFPEVPACHCGPTTYRLSC